MTPGKFLRLVWPQQGFYCIAHPFTPPGSSDTVWAHQVFRTITEAVTHAHRMANQCDVYFAVLSLEQERVWNADKVDYRTGQKGAWSQRTADNMLASRALFFDLDVGSEPGKYASQRDALIGLGLFLTKAKLPIPTMISSGRGIHVYWHLHEELPRDEWRKLAWHMRLLAEHFGLMVDKSRTIDSSSVLRVPGTFNWKDRSNPRAVEALQEGAVSPVAAIRQLVSDAMIAEGIIPTEPPRNRSPSTTPPDLDLGEQTFNDFGPPPTAAEVGSACAQVREIIASQYNKSHPHYGDLGNTAWYRGLLNIFKHVENGDDWCRKLTEPFPRSNADIESDLVRISRFAPARCETIAQLMPWGDGPCQTCPLKGRVPNPIAAARKTTKAAPPPLPSSEAPPIPQTAAAPTMAQLVAPSIGLMAATLPDPPAPFKRLKSGEIALERTNKDGEVISTTILHHDLYPIKRMTNEAEGREQQLWRAVLPRSGTRDFVIDADVLYDIRKLCSALANNGIYPNKAEVSALQDYMVAYISQLQKQLDAEKQAAHLGWIDDYSAFVLPDKTLLADGTARMSSLTEIARRSCMHLTKKGSLHEQVKLMEFYNRPQYIPNQSVILDSFGSALFYATGHAGIVVNLSGEPGASKSTTLYTAASVWGDPIQWPLNGTNRGATANARAQRIATNANLPTPVDEITHLPQRDVTDLVMNITQPGHRLRLNSEGQERTSLDNYRSSIMIATANCSLHSILSTDNAASTAGSMRVFEIKFVAQHIHSKAEADEYLRQLKLHFGHLGEIFMQFVIKNRAAVEHRVQQVVREIDQAARVQSSERFWSARIACGIVAGEICRALGILPYDVAPILSWSVDQQIPYMRGIVRDEYRDPLAVLSDYIAEKHGNIIVVDRSVALGVNTAGPSSVGSSAFTINSVHGALLGHYDTKGGILYLLKQGFKEHCNRIGASATRIIEELSQPRAGAAGAAPAKIVVERQVRRTLGAGTPLAKGQAWCFAVDMNHPDMSGAVLLQSVQGGAQTPGGAGASLAVVK